MKKIILSLLIVWALLIPVQIFAQEDTPQYNQNVDKSIADYVCTPSDDGMDLVRCINKGYRFGIAFGALALVFFVVLAGYFYIIGGESGKERGKGILKNAVVGMAILLLSYPLLNFINPDLVTFKPIQPPIFDAADLPSCGDIGFEDDCVIRSSTGEVQQVVRSPGGAKVPCPGQKLVAAKSLGLPADGNHQICEAFGQKLVVAYNNTKDIPWTITRTTTGAAKSQCHKPGNQYTGTCADIDFTSAKDVKNAASWNKLCRALRSAGVYPHNEVGHAKDGTVELRSKLTDCGGYHEETLATGDHIHAIWKQ